MTADSSIKKKPRRIWRWLRRIALTLFGLFVVALVSLWVNLEWEASKGRKELAAAIAETGESDPRWRWEEIEADLPPLPEAKNSMLVVKKANESFGKWEFTAIKLPNGRLVLEDRPAVNRRLSTQQLAIIRKELGEHEDSVALALSLKDYPQGRTPVQFAPNVLNTLLPHVQPVRSVVHLLELDTERQAHSGRVGEAPAHIVATLNAAASLREDPFLISMLVRVACRMIALQQTERLLGMGEWSEESCRALQERLSELRKEKVLLAALRGERSGFNRLFENFANGQLSVGDFFAQLDGPGHARANMWEQVTGLAYSYRLPADHAALLRWFNRACEAAMLPPWEQPSEWDELHDEIRLAKQTGLKELRLILFVLLTPAIKKVGQTTLRDQAYLACAEAALATERFRLANKRWPKSLAEVCPKFMPSVPLDPYNGKHLVYARRDDGVVIYSVGPDLEDDGGELLRHLPVGNYDPGFRLYDPDKRNLPALPQDDADEP